jgi:hypothetical protein
LSNTTGIFIGETELSLLPSRGGGITRFTTDGNDPDKESPVYTEPLKISENTTLKTMTVWEGNIRSRTRTFVLSKVVPRSAADRTGTRKVNAAYFEGEFREMPDFDSLTPVWTGRAANLSLDHARRGENYGLKFNGYIKIPETGVWIFYTRSDDGSQLFIGDQLVVDNGGVHGTRERKGAVALESGLHPITLTFFQGAGGKSLEVLYEGPSVPKTVIPADALFH